MIAMRIWKIQVNLRRLTWHWVKKEPVPVPEPVPELQMPDAAWDFLGVAEPQDPPEVQEAQTDRYGFQLKPGARAKKRNPIAATLLPMVSPKHLRDTEDMTTEELQEEARNARPLIKAMGWRDSAMLNPELMHTAFHRLVFFTGGLAFWPYFLFYAVPIAMGIVGLLVGHFGGDWVRYQVNAEQYEGVQAWAFHKITLLSMFGAGAFIFGFGGSMGSLALSTYGKVHADATVISKRNGHIIALLECVFPRLAYGYEKTSGTGAYFTGPDGNDGFQKGSLRFETDLNLFELTDPRQLYGHVWLHRSSFIGSTTSNRAALREKAKEAGRLETEKWKARQKKDDFWNTLSENKDWLFFLVCLVAMIVALMIGFDASEAASGIQDVTGVSNG